MITIDILSISASGSIDTNVVVWNIENPMKITKVNDNMSSLK